MTSGAERMLETLNANATADPAELLTKVRKAADEFAGGAGIVRHMIERLVPVSE